MLLDKLLTIGTDCTDACAAGNTLTAVTNADVIDLTAINRGDGEDIMWLVIRFTTAPVTNGTFMDVVVVTDADGTLAAGAQEQQCFHFLTADMAVGSKYVLPVGCGKKWLRYLGICTRVDAAYTTKAHFAAYLALDADTAMQ